MPLPPWKKRRRAPPRASWPLLLALLAGCAGLQPAPVPSSPFAAADRPFVVSPLEGYPLVTSPGRAQEVEAAHRALVEAGETARAAATAAALLAEDSGFHPASVLLAAVAFAAGDWPAVEARLVPVVAELPEYVAAQLLLGRAAERALDLPRAASAYHPIAGRYALADVSLARIRPRAAEILAQRVAEALARGRLDLAEDALAALQAWAPASPETLGAALAVGEASGDPQRALAAARRLVDERPGDRELLERLAELELAGGDAGRGLRILEDLAAAYPEDAGLADRTAAARFRWRLQLLPEAVREVVRRPVLTRGDYAGLVYWLFPSVRHGQAERATIASDIFEHPLQREIARVVNLGLVDVDPSLHLFRPDQPVTREQALAGMLRVLAASTPPAACSMAAVDDGATTAATCAAAARCGLIASPADCLPGAELGGAEAVEMARRAQEQLGGGGGGG